VSAMPERLPGGAASGAKISVVVPSFNHAEFLPDALDSIFQQNYRPLQVIVIDGGSKDGTVDILRDYAERYAELEWVSEPDSGPADAVNKGLARVSGDIVGIQSSDDLYHKDVFPDVIAAFVDNDDVGFVYGDVDGIDKAGTLLYRRKIPEFSWESFFGVSLAIPQSSIFFRAAIAQEVGGWNGDYYSCDIDYWMRILFRTRALHLRKSLSSWRRYPEQRTRPDVAAKLWGDYWSMIDNSPDVAAASLRVRRLAHASKYILAMRFPPTRSKFVVCGYLMIGFLLHPTFVRYNPWGIYMRWVPGFSSFRRAVLHAKQRLGGVAARK